MARRPVTCRKCGYTTTPVSGFCPRCLELLPVGPRLAAAPLLLGVLAALVLGVGLTAALNRTAPGVVSVQETNVPASATTPSATTPAATTQSAPAVTPGQPLPSASSVAPPAAGAAASPAPTAEPLAPAPPGASPSPTAVLGVEALPSTATEGEVMH